MPTQLVADAIAHYDELLLDRFRPELWWQDQATDIRQHLFEDEAPTGAFVLRPLMIDEATYKASCTSLNPLVRAFSIAADRLASDEPLRRALGMPAYLEPLLEIDRVHGKPTCMGRLDGIMSADGKLTIIEFNSEPQSAPFQYEVERAFDRRPITAELAKRFSVRSVNLYDQMYATLAERGHARGKRMPCVAVIDRALWLSHRRASIFRPLMYSAARGCPLLFVEPEEIEYRDGKVTAHGIQIDMVAFPTWELVINARKRLVKLIKAIAEQDVDVYAGLSRGLLCSYKTIFELLSSPEYRDMFPADCVEALVNHVPWTRVLRERTTDFGGTSVDLLPFVEQNRASLVIKPAGGGGGGNITIGPDVDDAIWAAAIKRGLAQNWIVQQLAVPERQSFPVAQASGAIAQHDLNCEFTPYAWNGTRVEGVLCRLVAGSVIFDFGDRPTAIGNGIETATWIIDRR
jgi:hypothetical protein